MLMSRAGRVADKTVWLSYSYPRSLLGYDRAIGLRFILNATFVLRNATGIFAFGDATILPCRDRVFSKTWTESGTCHSCPYFAA